MIDDQKLPLRPAQDITPKAPPLLAPAWVAFITAWLGLIVFCLSVLFPLLPGSKNPRAELEHRQSYSFADRFLPVPIYGVAVALFLGIVVLWQMRKEPRPFPEPLVRQRAQACVGIVFAILAAGILYTWVALRGPR